MYIERRLRSNAGGRSSVRVCLISPGHLSTNPRLLKEARALTEAGHDVSVVCGQYSAWAREKDRALIDRRWRVEYVPFGPTEAPKSTYVVQGLRHRAARFLAQAGISSFAIWEAAHTPVGPNLSSAAMRVPADLYIAHYPAALPAAARAARKYGVAYAFDAEDYHLGDLPDSSEHKVEKRIIHAIESRYLSGAAYVTAASPMIADAYAQTYRIPRPTVVLNVFPRANAPSSNTPRGTAEPRPSLYWFSQTIGSGRGLETAIEAIARAESRPHLYLRGTPAKAYDDRLRTLAHSAGVADRLHLLPPETPDEMERLGAQYDLGYLGEVAQTRNRQIALTNKLFSYLIGGVPIVGSDVPAHVALAPNLGEAMSLFRTADAAALAETLDGLLMNPDRLAAARSHAWSLGQHRFCWEVEKRAFLDAVAKDGRLAYRCD